MTDKVERSPVDRLISNIESKGELFHDKNGDCYITMKFKGSLRTYLLQSKELKEIVAHSYFRSNSQTSLRPSHLNEAMQTLHGHAKYQGKTREVHTRVAKFGDNYYLDTCNNQWQVIKLSVEGVEITDQSDVRFVRSKSALPLFTPALEGTIEDLLMLVNIGKTQEVLLITVLLELLRPDTAYPVLEFIGEQGSGKSSTQANIIALLDPKKSSLRTSPKRAEDIFVAANNNHIVSYNNVSSLSTDVQDALCCLSTGGGYASRKLYTNAEEHSFDVKRPPIINGLAPLVTAPDLLSRTVQVPCPAIVQRASDIELKDRLKKHGPRALGFLLNVFCETLDILPRIEIEDAPRLMDFAILGEAVSLYLGYERGYFKNVYNQALSQSAFRSIDAVPALQCLIHYMSTHDDFEGTVGGLLEKLIKYETSRSRWTMTPHSLSNALRKYQGALRQLGITIDYLPQRRLGQMLRVSKVR